PKSPSPVAGSPQIRRATEADRLVARRRRLDAAEGPADVAVVRGPPARAEHGAHAGAFDGLLVDPLRDVARHVEHALRGFVRGHAADRARPVASPPLRAPTELVRRLIVAPRIPGLGIGAPRGPLPLFGPREALAPRAAERVRLVPAHAVHRVILPVLAIAVARPAGAGALVGVAPLRPRRDGRARAGREALRRALALSHTDLVGGDGDLHRVDAERADRALGAALLHSIGARGDERHPLRT